MADAPRESFPTGPMVDRLVELAFEEDLGRGDATTSAVLLGGETGTGVMLAKQRMVVAGLPLVEAVFARLDRRVVVTTSVADGAAVKAGTVLAELRGPAAALLAGERTALNFVQRLSGVSTLAAAFVRAAGAARVRVTDTRKTTPGWRALERYAVRVGGGCNHRPDLGSGVLIKDNHIAVVGGVGEAVRRARTRAPHVFRVEVEVESLAQLDEAIAAGADVILLDNFKLGALGRAVKRAAGRAVLEASGGVTLDRIGAIARTGVDLISVGALTHSAPSVDISLDFALSAGGR